MFEVTTLTNIMGKNTNLAGQPVICQLLSFRVKSWIGVSLIIRATGIIKH
jgi:hypothetical protein